MIHKTISISEQVNNLSVTAELLYIGIIIHADDDGRLKGNPKYLRATIFPMRQISLRHTEKLINEIRKQELIYYWEQNGEWFIEIPTWKDYQYIQKDRYHGSILPSYPNKNANKLNAPSIQNDDDMDTQSNIVKSSLIESSEAKSNDSLINDSSHGGIEGLRNKMKEIGLRVRKSS